MFCNRIVKLRQKRQRQQGIRRLNDTSIDAERDQNRAYSEKNQFFGQLHDQQYDIDESRARRGHQPGRSLPKCGKFVHLRESPFEGSGFALFL